MRATDMEIQHDVMMCPACHYAIRANVTIKPNLGSPVLGDDGTATVPLSPTVERFAITHHCTGRVTSSAGDPEATS